MRFYHGTSKSRAESIRKQGLLPLDGSVNLTTDREYAFEWAIIWAEEDGDEPILIEFDINPTTLTQWKAAPNDDSTRYQGDPDYFTMIWSSDQAIPVEAIIAINQP